MTGKKMPYLEGKDGRLYFNYNVGAAYLLKNKKTGTENRYEILDCELRRTTEYYTVKINDVECFSPFSANRLHFILNFENTVLQTISEGERREIPLLPEEVEQFVKKGLHAAYKLARAKAKAALKDNKDYATIKANIQTLNDLYVAKLVRGTPSERNDMESKLNAEEEKKAKLLQSLGINLEDLIEPQKCQLCFDTGFIYAEHFCSCMQNRSEEIKAWNAAERLKAKLKARQTV